MIVSNNPIIVNILLGITIWADTKDWMNTGKLKCFASGLINSIKALLQLIYTKGQECTCEFFHFRLEVYCLYLVSYFAVFFIKKTYERDIWYRRNGAGILWGRCRIEHYCSECVCCLALRPELMTVVYKNWGSEVNWILLSIFDRRPWVSLKRCPVLDTHKGNIYIKKKKKMN